MNIVAAHVLAEHLEHRRSQVADRRALRREAAAHAPATRLATPRRRVQLRLRFRRLAHG